MSSDALVKTRRAVLVSTFSAGAALAQKKSDPAKSQSGEGEEDVSPTEDLMREHGLLNRVLLLYEDSLGKLGGNDKPDPGVIAGGAGIIHRFIEDYHEKLEENYLFPRFEKAGKLTDLVHVLKQQHEAGRRITREIERLASSALGNASDRDRLKASLASFIHMYRPHEAREDTVLFPALHHIISRHEWDSLGEDFEKREHELFGKDGFEGMVEKVAGLEKSAGIYDLAQFTPRT
ncbi:MAG TPA: hemerythrin domain-containing protein [Bryobacteraceae bacterium]|nr:hemerythrin domain-containing protein [Bryobacteraceae bacterium]